MQTLLVFLQSSVVKTMKPVALTVQHEARSNISQDFVRAAFPGSTALSERAGDSSIDGWAGGLSSGIESDGGSTAVSERTGVSSIDDWADGLSSCIRSCGGADARLNGDCLLVGIS